MPTASLDTIFTEAVEISDPVDRAAYLKDACGADEALRHRVEALVAAHLKAGDFLNQPVVSLDEVEDRDDQSDELESVVGAFVLKEKIGEGGMGTVYVAEQTQPVKRMVALKIIKRGMNSKEIVRRFAVERQALALMDHPNIARVLDAGTAADGRPYFVMELVRGLAVTEYCDRARLPAAGRLALFVHVCRAVEHAHQKGVIHRDLKPSNVLVTLHDGEPVAKVIDFGIAKAVNQPLVEGTVYTRLTQLLGTPAYMSPEQTELSCLDIDTRSDVYSLGVLLYELLTGATPFDSAALSKVGFDEMRRMIREDEPPRPSARISTLDAAARSTVSAKRGVDDRRLARQLSGDLDWIVMKALEKDRNRRYASAGAFAADVERFLANEPVQARPPSRAYRLQKLVQRNRSAVLIGAVIGIALIAIAGAVGWGLSDMLSRRTAALSAATLALDESADHYRSDRPDAAMATAKRAVDTLTGVVGGEKLLEKAHQQVADLEMVERLEYLEHAGQEIGHFQANESSNDAYHNAFRKYGIDPVVLTENAAVARVREQLIARELVNGLYIWAKAVRNKSQSTDPIADKLRSIAAAADADPLNRRVWEVTTDGTPQQVAALAAEVSFDTAHPTTIDRLGIVLGRKGHRAEAEALLRKSIQWRPARFSHNINLGALLKDSQSDVRLIESLGFYRAALALRQRSVYVMNTVGVVLTDRLQRPAEGEEWFRRILQIKPDFHIARANLSVALEGLGRHAEAVDIAREAVKAMPNVQTYRRLGDALRRARRLEESSAAYREAIAFEPRDVDGYHVRGLALEALGRKEEAIASFHEAIRREPAHFFAYEHLGQLLTEKGDVSGAMKLYQAGLKINPEHAVLHNRMGILLRQQGKAEDAVAAFRTAIKLAPNDPTYHFNVHIALTQLNRIDDAASELRETIRLRPSHAQAHYALGNLLSKLERHDEAEVAHRTAIEFDSQLAESHCNLGRLLQRKGQYAESLKYYQRGHELGSRRRNWPYPSAEWVENARRLVDLAPRLPAILSGQDTPDDTTVAAACADVAIERERYVRGAELYQVALTAHAKRNDPRSQQRYRAACAAARAGCGQGKDAGRLDDAAREAWRAKALKWLREELISRQRLMAEGATAARLSEWERLWRWTTDRTLSGVRDSTELDLLPSAERAEWEQFWADVRAVVDQGASPSNPKK